MKHIILFTILLSSTFFIFSCKDKEGEDKKDDNTQQVNPNEAQNNNEIIYQNTWGAKKSSIHRTVKVGNNIYGTGTDSGQETLVKLGANGQEEWTKIIGVDVFDITATSDDMLIIVGRKNSKGNISVFDLNGNLKSERNISVEAMNSIHYSAIDFIEEENDGNGGLAKYFVLGANLTSNAEIQRPVLHFIKINSSGDVTVTENPNYIIN